MTDSGKSVFLSYASQDAPAAHQLSDALRAAGIEVWLDQSELRGGDAWDALIRRQIKGCYLFVPLISANTQSREEGYFRREWNLAVARTLDMAEDRAFLLPVVIDATTDVQARVPEKFREVHWTRLPAGADKDAFVTHVHRLLSPDAAAASKNAARTPGSSESSASLAAATLRRLPLTYRAAAWIVGGLLTLSLGYLVTQRFASHQHSVAAIDTLGKKSIAVLPFADMSERRDQEYFSDGLAEELIEQLGRTPGLKVIARTSSFSFKGKSDDIATIAAKLKVTHILEGSVRRAGDHLRVSTQLIRAESGEPIWSETFDREFKDVFTIQDEIATAVVSALKARLAAGATPKPSHGTTNPEAYSAFLLGRQLRNQATESAMLQAVEAYQRAIHLDPSYAEAYAYLGWSEYWLSDFHGDELAKSAEQQTVQRALDLDPQLAVGYAYRGSIRLAQYFDWVGAAADFQQALALEPANSLILELYADYLSHVGRLEEAVATYRAAIEQDPLANETWGSLGLTLTAQGHYAAAYDAFRHAQAIRLDPTTGFNLATLQLLDGKALAAMDTAHAISVDFLRDSVIAMAAHTLADAKASKQTLDALTTTHAREAAYQIAEVYAWRGERNTAFEWLERAYRQQDNGLLATKTDPLLASLRSDPRLPVFLRKMNFPP
jgi:TolB-like protein/tetratricopeptide (TPR) repeat protein